MPRLSQTTKEIIKTAAVLIIVGLIIACYAVYPLNRTKAAMGRVDLDDYEGDSLLWNDPAAYAAAGLACTGVSDDSLADSAEAPVCDTFRVEADGLTTLACLYLPAQRDSGQTPMGTVCLLHDDGHDRDSLVPLAQRLVTSGYSTIVYDQRASGRSTGKYRGEGQYEAADLQEVIRYLDIRDRIVHPLLVVGFSTGADAALLCAQEEKRIDGVVAVRPYLSTTRWLDCLRDRHDMFWFPFFRTMMWWWYDIRSSYAAPYRSLDEIKAVGRVTLLIVDADDSEDAEVLKLKEASPTNLLDIRSAAPSADKLTTDIADFVTAIATAYHSP